MSNVSGKLSSRVLNMKFMKEARQVAEDKQQEEEVLKVKDTSEWSLENSHNIINTFKKPHIVSMGVSQLKSFTASAIGDENEKSPRQIQSTSTNCGRRTFSSKNKNITNSILPKTETIEPVKIREITKSEGNVDETSKTKKSSGNKRVYKDITNDKNKSNKKNKKSKKST
ncbi:Mpp6p SCDLUD_001173 [Saccharomycodes ludwigii]|uniref:Mpp6p n=1 Tax=Saccharomycodes ludwigii TaxID=36035 RepID=UPI001E820D28|nr:hypothetical protein SCDLUD_001173 [Saccharomycodes ludwigii]KAH3903532.1 hypothetical protein SCDLUD_001173 [Saccharomycodes ludwigii]